MRTRNIFAVPAGIVVVGIIIGVLAPLLEFLGNPGNMGICVAGFGRDIAGAVGLHQDTAVQYMRPEIPGFVLGSLAASLIFREFDPRGGSSPMTRFVLGMTAMIGMLIFLGSPCRIVLRLSGGDGSAFLGFLGFVAGVYIGTLFFRKSFNLGRSYGQSTTTGLVLPMIMLGLLALRFIYPPLEDGYQNGVLFYSAYGSGVFYAPLGISLSIGLAVGFLAQRSRFCAIAAVRDLILFRHVPLTLGLLALLITAFAVNLSLGQFHPGFEGQPEAHNLFLWNFIGMLTAGLAFALAGGCSGRQLFMSGEGNSDAAVFVLGMLAGAALAYNWGLAGTSEGLGPNGAIAAITGLVVCLGIGFANLKKRQPKGC